MSESQREELHLICKCELCSKELIQYDSVCFRDYNLNLHYVCLDCAIAMHAQDKDTWKYCKLLCACRRMLAEERVKSWREKKRIAFSEPKRKNQRKGESK